MNSKIVPALLLIIIITLAYSLQFFQTEINMAQNQASILETQLEQYKNSTSNIQKDVSALEIQLYSLQNPVYNVTIANVTSTGWMPLVSVTVENGFYITIKNTGVRDVGGLTFQFYVLDNNGSVWDSQDYSVGLVGPMQLGVLHVQEFAVIQAAITSHVGVSFEGKSFQVIVLYDKTVLAESSVVLEHGYG
jgi:hypothetical protein